MLYEQARQWWVMTAAMGRDGFCSWWNGGVWGKNGRMWMLLKLYSCNTELQRMVAFFGQEDS